MTRRSLLALLASSGAIAWLPARWSPAFADEPVTASPWFTDTATRVRLIGGGSLGGKPLAGIELALDAGWKTYWRHPGSSGVPPHFEWAGSENVADAKVLFPAPHRFKDPDGDTIGYKGAAVWPVEITPRDAGKPVALKLTLDFGVCRDVCVPVQAELALALPAAVSAGPAPPPLQQALAAVPRAKPAGTDPAVERIAVELSATPPRIVIDARFPGSQKAADAFLEAPDGLWIPFAKVADGAPAGLSRFLVDLSDGAEIPDLKGKEIRLTLVGERGQSETSFKLE